MPNLCDAIAGIRRRLAFIDTTRNFVRHLPPGTRTRLERIYGRRIRVEQVRVVDPLTGLRWSPGANIWTQLPTPELLRELEPYGTLGRVDIAVEYVMSEPEALWRVLSRLLRVRWSAHPTRMVEQCTCYIGNYNREVCFYWDKRSKHTDEPCLRLNICFWRRRVLRAQGLTTVDELLAANPADIIDHNLRFYQSRKLVPLPHALVPDRLTWPARQPRPQ
jgi:hypothetical protein